MWHLPKNSFFFFNKGTEEQMQLPIRLKSPLAKEFNVTNSICLLQAYVNPIQDGPIDKELHHFN